MIIPGIFVYSFLFLFIAWFLCFHTIYNYIQIGYHIVRYTVYYMPKLNQAFSLVDSTVQYFPSYCTLQKLNQIAWKPACNKRNTTLRYRTKKCIALSLVKPVNSPFGFVHQVWPASCNTLLRSAPSCSIPILFIRSPEYDSWMLFILIILSFT